MRVLWAWVVLSLCLSASLVRADVDACFDAAERGQTERDERKLSSARSSFVTCADAACPEAVRKECITWLADVEARLPTLVIAVRDASGNDLPDAEVSVDGMALDPAAVGREFTVDPGPHQVVAKRGELTSEAQVVAAERERGRTVTLTLAAPEPEKPPPPPPPEAPKTRPWLGPVVTGGAGVALLITAGALTLSANSKAKDLRHDCAPGCKRSEVDALKVRLHVADAALGVGAAAVAAGLVWYFWPRERKSEPRVSVAPTGRGFLVRGAF